MPDLHPPSDEEIAAALIAVSLVMREEADASRVEEDGWRHSAKLSVQRLRPARTAVPPRWNTIERLRSATAGGFFGVIGL